MNAGPLVIVEDSLPLLCSEIAGAASTERGSSLPPPMETTEEESACSSHLEPDYASAVQLFWYGHRRLEIADDLEQCWKAVKAMAAADGVLSDPERLALVGKMCAAGVPARIVEAVMQWDERGAKPGELLDAAMCSESARAEMGAWVAYEGISAAIADGDLATGEVESFYAFAAAMRVAPSSVDALIALCRREAALRAQRIALLRSDVRAVMRTLLSADR